MESDIKHKNPNFKEDKTENVSRALFFAEQQEGHHLKSPIRVFPNPKSGFRQYNRMNDENFDNEIFKSPSKLSANASPMDTHRMVLGLTHPSNRHDYSPFDRRPTDSPYTSFAKGLSLSPAGFPSSPKPHFAAAIQIYNGTPSPNKYPHDDSDPSPFKKRLFSDAKPSTRQHENGHDDEHEDHRLNGDVPMGLNYQDSNQPSPRFSYQPPRPYIPPNVGMKKASTTFQAVECRFSKANENEDEFTLNPNKNEMRGGHLKTPSPGLKAPIMIGNFNSFTKKNGVLENIITKKEMSADVQSNSEEDTMERKSIDEEDDDLNNKKKICCNCKKSRCLKLYCDCFARGDVCSKECNCVNCLNTENNEDDRKNAMMGILDRNPNAFKPKVDRTESPAKIQETIDKGRVRHVKGCNCKKSGCQKKYCECYQAGVKCTENCKCENCKNMDINSAHKRAQNFGFGGTMSTESKCEPNYSEISYSGSKRNKVMENEDDEMSEEEPEEVRRYSNPRKQNQSYQNPAMIDEMLKKKRDSRMSTPRIMKKEEEIEVHDKSDKKGTHGSFRTPNSYNDPKKGNFNEYTPSPGKGAMYEGRTRRSVRPFIHNDYEMEK